MNTKMDILNNDDIEDIICYNLSFNITPQETIDCIEKEGIEVSFDIKKQFLNNKKNT